MVKPAVKTVILNETVTFQCTAGKRVDAKIAWSKEAGSLPVGRHSIIQGTLYIKNVIASDNGIYVCTISTDQGAAQATVTLNVKGKNKIGTFLLETDNKTNNNAFAILSASQNYI